MEFKVGQKVKRITTFNQGGGNNNIMVKVGDIGVVRRVGYHGFVDVEFHGCIIANSKKYLEVVVEKEYNVIKPFTILDVYKERPKRIGCYRSKIEKDFEKMFEDLLQVCLEIDPDNMAEEFDSFTSMIDYEPLMNNLLWLEEKGFIKEKVEEVILKAGMRLKTPQFPNSKYKIIDINDRIGILVNGSDLFCDNGNYLSWNQGSTLREINDMEDSYDFEVIND